MWWADLCMARDVVKKMFSLDDQSMTDDTSKSSEKPKPVTLEVPPAFILACRVCQLRRAPDIQLTCMPMAGEAQDFLLGARS